MPQKLLTPEASAAIRQLDEKIEERAATTARSQVQLTHRRRFFTIQVLTIVAVAILFSRIGAQQSGWREQWLVIAIHALPAAIAFILGWRLRRFRTALGAASALMLSLLLTVLFVAGARDGYDSMWRSLWSWYAAQELGRFVVIGIAAGVGGFALRRVWDRVARKSRDA